MSLSHKINRHPDGHVRRNGVWVDERTLSVDDVREFIKELKDKIIKEGFVSRADKDWFHKIIDELAGDKLIHSPLPNGSTGCREKEVKAGGCQLKSDNGFSGDTNSPKSQKNSVLLGCESDSDSTGSEDVLDKNPAHYCMSVNCGSYIARRGWCSEECYNKSYPNSDKESANKGDKDGS